MRLGHERSVWWRDAGCARLNDLLSLAKKYNYAV